jgi:hypothetical protein
MAITLTFDDFKTLMQTDTAAKERVSGTSDIIDFDNGSMIIHRYNINKYLERYMCKDEDDLKDTMWYNHGVYVKILD